MQILVICDDTAINRFLRTVLENAGHVVTDVQRPTERLAEVLHKRDLDLVICDLDLTHAKIRGVDLVQFINQHAPRLPLLAISSQPAGDVEAACLEAGAARYLEKPVRTATLLEEVAMASHGRMRLAIGILDSDPAYGMVLKQYLLSAGCEAKLWFSVDDAEAGANSMASGSVLLIDEQVDGAVALISQATKSGRSVIVSKNPDSQHDDDDYLRDGAALVVERPLDIDNLLTQLGFIAAPW